MDTEKLKRTIHAVIRLIVEGEYERLEQLANGRYLTAQQIRNAVEEWPYKFVMPHTDSLDDLVMGYFDRAGNPHSWAVDAYLWTAEEGKSDLTLQLSVIESASDLYDIEIEDLHVL